MARPEPGADMKRREFLGVAGGAVAWPVAVRAQQPGRMRRVGVLINTPANDTEWQDRVRLFEQRLAELGWIRNRNLIVDYRWDAQDMAQARQRANELVALGPDVLVGNGLPSLPALAQASSTIPIVFAQIADPVGTGFVASLARPGGNVTGFANFEFSIGGKWLEIMKEAAPAVTRVMAIMDRAMTTNTAMLSAMTATAPSLNIRVTDWSGYDPGELKQAIDTFAREPNGGLIVLPRPVSQVNRELITSLAIQHRLPALYPFRFYATSNNGLMSYGPNPVDLYRQVAGYVDRILRGEKPADLPVQQPTKYEFIANLRTAKLIGLTVPPTLLARADEVIE